MNRRMIEQDEWEIIYDALVLYELRARANGREDLADKAEYLINHMFIVEEE